MLIDDSKKEKKCTRLMRPGSRGHCIGADRRGRTVLVIGLCSLLAPSSAIHAGRCEEIASSPSNCFYYLRNEIPTCLDDSNTVWSGTRILGSAVAERLCGAGPVVRIDGEGGDDYISGGTNAESILCGDGSDHAWAAEGDDYIHGGSGVDTIFGNQGSDKIRGGSESDVLHGGSGIDTVYGDQDDDQVFGENDTDYLYGGLGNDDLDGGPGDDFLYGQDGNDLYVYDLGDGNDLLGDAWGNNVLLFRGISSEDVTTQVVNGVDLKLVVSKNGITGQITIVGFESYPGWSIAFEDQPNVILIFADDLGYGDIQPFRPPGGSVPKIYTPNLLRMAAEGTRFTQFYSGAGHCPPARSSLMEGRHTGRTDVNSAGNPFFSRDDLPILPQLLRQHGYQTAIVGKWGMAQRSYQPPQTLGGDPTLTVTNGDPVVMGFDRFFGFLKHHDAHAYYLNGYWDCSDATPLPVNPSSQDIENHEPFYAGVFQQFVGYGYGDEPTSSSVPAENPFVQPPASGRYEIPPNVYSHDEFIGRGLEEIDDSRRKGPFFLYMPLTIPHAELVVPDDAYVVTDEQGYAHDYRSEINNEVVWHPCQCQGGPAPPICATVQSSTYPRWNDRVKATYAAMISRLDKGVGEILDRLVELRLDTSTLVIFTSDNGPHSEGGMSPAYFDSTAGLSGSKYQLLEGGIRVPTIMWRPGHVQAGKERSNAVALWDVFPTVAELAGVASAEIDAFLGGGGTDGSSFTALFDDATAGTFVRGKPLYWEHPGTGDFSQALRDGSWKALRCAGTTSRCANNDQILLYDLALDPRELTNLAGGSAYCSRLRLMIDWMNAERSEDIACLPTYPAPCAGPASNCP